MSDYSNFAITLRRQGMSFSQIGAEWRAKHGGSKSPSGQMREHQDAHLTGLLKQKVPFHDALNEARQMRTNPSGVKLDVGTLAPWALAAFAAYWVEQKTGFFANLFSGLNSKVSGLSTPAPSATQVVCGGVTWNLVNGMWTASSTTAAGAGTLPQPTATKPC